MKEAVWGGIFIGIVISVILMVGLMAMLPPDGITPDRLQGCQLAGYGTVVVDYNKDVFCASYPDLVLWVE